MATLTKIPRPEGLSPTVEALNNIGVQAKLNKQFNVSILALKRAIKLQPQFSMSYTNLGTVYWDLGEYELSRKYYQEALDVETGDKSLCYTNLGQVHSSLHDYKTSIECFDKALELNSDDNLAKWNKSLIQLQHGNWEEGWNGYDTRIIYPDPSIYIDFKQPTWNGESLKGKTLLVKDEQGLGDGIFFARFLRVIKSLWPSCHIMYVLNSSMWNLMWDYQDIVQFIPEISYAKYAHYAINLCSIPRVLGVKATDDIPDPGYIKERIAFEERNTPEDKIPAAPHPTFKVGIVWTGNPLNQSNKFRSIPFEYYLDLADNLNVVLYSLQAFGAETIQKAGANGFMVDLSKRIEKDSFITTARYINQLDLVITVCTSVAHLAGALGKRTWLLLHNDPYWLWGLEGDTTHWYPSLRLFRNTERSWDNLMDTVKSELDILAEKELSNEGNGKAEENANDGQSGDANAEEEAYASSSG